MTDKKHHNALPPGYKLHWYVIKEILGRGGFGITYLAQDTNLNRNVAIKEYLPVEFSFRDSTDSVNPMDQKDEQHFKWGLERFIVEAQTLAKFEHPNIVRVISVFEENNTGYMVMSYEYGIELQSTIQNGKTLPEQELLKIVFPLLDGLEMIHDAGFIHRDIKPQNILIRPDGTPVLIDFGSARQSLGQKTKTLTSLVSPGYAPFEQYYSKSDKQGPWTDIYAMAATMYRCISGLAPMSAVDRSEAIVHGSGDIFVSALELGRGIYSDHLLNAIDHGLKFRPDDRPQSIEEWKLDFSGITKPIRLTTRNEEDIPTDMSVTSFRNFESNRITRKSERKNKKLPLIIGGISLLLLVSGFFVFKDYFLNGQTDSDQIAEAIPETIPETKPLPANETRILSLLNQAHQDIEMQRLVEPEGDNAYYRYREILKLDPENVLAQQGIATIGNRLVDLALQAIESDDFELAREYLTEAESMAPDNPRLAEIRHGFRAKQREKIRAEIEKEILSQQEAERIKIEQEKNAQLVNDLLAQATVDMSELRQAEPEGNNAYEKYRKVLEIDPDNQQAKQGIQLIVGQYLTLAKRSADSGAYDKALERLAIAEKILPDSPKVQSVMEEIKQKRSNAEQTRLAEERKKQQQQQLIEEENRQARLQEEEERLRAEQERLRAESEELERQRSIAAEQEQERLRQEALLKEQELARQEEAKKIASTMEIKISDIGSKYQSMGLRPAELMEDVKKILAGGGYTTLDANQASPADRKIIELIFKPTDAPNGRLVKWNLTVSVKQGGNVIWSAQDEKVGKQTNLYGVDVEARGIDDLSDARETFIKMVQYFVANHRIN
jgi:serine/threonine protein kinase